MKNWSISKTLSEGFKSERRPPKEREYIYASEIGKQFFDRYYKMNGYEPSEKLSSRTYFRFFIGDLLEYGILRLFHRAGMQIQVQKGREKCIVETEGLFPVSGKYDAIISADGDWDTAIRNIKITPLDVTESFIDRYAIGIAEYCKKHYPEGFDNQLFEIKTINSMSLKSNMKKGLMAKEYYHYHLQLYTYMKYLGVDKGIIFYISKDDGVFHVQEVHKTEQLEKDWLADVKGITECIRKDIPPEFPQPYRLKNDKYVVDWSVVGSDFLEFAGIEDKEEFQHETKKLVGRLNYKITKAKKEKEKGKK